MKLVIDLQGAQTSGSRFRGIGRYSVAFAQALARQAGSHDIWIGLNGLFPESIEPIRAAFEGLVPQDRIVVWQTPGPVAESAPTNGWRVRAAEILREAFLAGLAPDIVHVSSMFEGYIDDSVTSIGRFETNPTSVTLYDLIPMIYRDLYLSSPPVADWYQRKIDSLRRARLWLAISEASRHDGIERLQLNPDSVINVSTAASEFFMPIVVGETEARTVRERYGLTRPFAMYTGGIDPRKNIEGLIVAYAKLPAAIRSTHQLAVVCAATSYQLDALRNMASKRGLGPDEVVFTGFVPDPDLLLLYNLCVGFVFPSWYEGFGLPALEAMQCGTPVIASDCSSLPEVVGRADALFDPHDENDVAECLHRLLTDEGFRTDLRQSGLARAKTFSWDNSARRAWDGYEQLADRVRIERGRASPQRRVPASADVRPRLAYLSPLPPAPSGIADFSADLLPELAHYYAIDVVTDTPPPADSWIARLFTVRSVAWFDQNAHVYDRVLYNFGNADAHRPMFGLLERHPGTVVLHDFFLGDTLDRSDNEAAFARALYASHGYRAVRERATTAKLDDVLVRYPANLPVLQQANGVIVPATHTCRLADTWYGTGFAAAWAHIPMPIAPAAHNSANRPMARATLGVDEDAFVVCSFGALAKSRCHDRLLEIWNASPLAANPVCRLVFVGEATDMDGTELRKMIARSPGAARIDVTGPVPPTTRQAWLAAADVAVQLSCLSRGESTHTALVCIDHGLATIFNAHGALDELPAGYGVRLPDEFGDDALQSALLRLQQDTALRWSIGAGAQRLMRKTHQPAAVGKLYRDAIERFAESGMQSRPTRLIETIAGLDDAPSDAMEWVAIAQSIAVNHPPVRARNLLVDVSALIEGKSAIPIDADLLTRPIAGCRIEPIYADRQGTLRYARRYTLEAILDCPGQRLEDDPVEAAPGDIYLCLDQPLQAPQAPTPALARLRRQGVVIIHVLSVLGYDNPAWRHYLGQWADGAICRSRAAADDLVRWLGQEHPARERRFLVGTVPPDTGTTECGVTPFVDLVLQDAWYCALYGAAADADDGPSHRRA